jgi:hypothetical protein
MKNEFPVDKPQVVEEEYQDANQEEIVINKRFAV